MVNVKLLNHSGKLIKHFHTVKAAYAYANKKAILNFSVQTTLIH